MRRIIAAIQTRISLICVLASIGFCGRDDIFPSRVLKIDISKKKVGQYQKLELEIEVNDRYENPFDPDVVDLVVLLKTPDNVYVTLPTSPF